MSVVMRRINAGGSYTNGARNEVFAQARSGDPTDYAWVEVYNDDAATSLPAGKVWLTIDTAGAAVTLAVADGVAQAGDYVYSIDPATLTYSAPTSKGAGLSVPALGPGQKCLLALRRVLSGATATSPETNQLNYATA